MAWRTPSEGLAPTDSIASTALQPELPCVSGPIMPTLNLILTYAGRLPNYFPLFLASCARNDKVNWTLLTDHPPENPLPANVRWSSFSIADLKARVERVLGLRPRFTDPYKICDFRPAIAALYPELVSGFDLWGHCDPDVVWGDLQRILPAPGSPLPPKIQTRGALSIYRNDEVGNNLFRLPHPMISYRDAFENPRYALFDEWCGLWKLLRRNQVPVVERDEEVAEIDSDHFDLRLNHSRANRFPQAFVWESGRLFRYYSNRGGLERDEFAYAHLQKRSFAEPEGSTWERFAILPGKFVCVRAEGDLRQALSMNQPRPLKSALMQMRRPIRYWRSLSKIDRGYSRIRA
jgi:hypothetical protein